MNDNDTIEKIQSVFSTLSEISYISIYDSDYKEFLYFYTKYQELLENIDDEYVKILIMLYFYFLSKKRFIFCHILNKVYCELTKNNIDLTMTISIIKKRIKNDKLNSYNELLNLIEDQDPEKALNNYIKNARENLELWNCKNNNPLKTEEIDDILEKTKEILNILKNNWNIRKLYSKIPGIVCYLLMKKGLKIKTKYVVSKIFGCSENAIRHTYKELLNFLKNSNNNEIDAKFEEIFEQCKHVARLYNEDKEKIIEIIQKMKKHRVCKSKKKEERYLAAITLYLLLKKRVFNENKLKNIAEELKCPGFMKSMNRVSKTIDEYKINYSAGVEHWEKEFFENMDYFLTLNHKLSEEKKNNILKIVKEKWNSSKSKIISEEGDTRNVLKFLGALLYYLHTIGICDIIIEVFGEKKKYIENFIELCSGFSMQEIGDFIKNTVGVNSLEDAIKEFFGNEKEVEIVCL